MAPRFSIVTPVYETPAPVLEAMLGSVTAQTFGDWELCLVDDGSSQPHVQAILERAARRDPRIRTRRRAENGGIVAASNDALAMAQGEFVALLDHDDELHPEALQKVHEALVAAPEGDYVYTDEDKIDGEGRHSGPFYKPDWSPERFRTQMYTCHLSVLRRALVEEVGGFHAEFDGSQDWDLVLRVTEKAREVLHVPEVLYHWRMLDSSVAGGGQAAKPYAYEAGTRAVQAHCDRTGFAATVRHDEERSGVYHLDPDLPATPLVSIVMPTAGREREVRCEETVLATHCVRSVLETSTYGAFEVVCVVDTSIDRRVVDELQALDRRVRIVWFDGPFSFSRKVNVGALASEGEHVLLLNDDMEVVTPDWIERLVMYSSVPEVGAVGARLLFGDGRLQHVGVMCADSSPGHLYHGFAGDHPGYANTVLVANNYLAVTGACLMTRREVFDSLGGLSNRFPLSFNDVDYCLKARQQGLRTVYDPDTVLYHFESSSRSPKVSDWELEGFRRRWGQATARDPYLNPNFDRHTVHMVPPVYMSDGTAA
jgi:GT2 family glycosyltransferase